MALAIASGLTVVAFWLTGFAAGYGMREYISRRRRSRAKWTTVFDRAPDNGS
jgi:hypothetical protein